MARSERQGTENGGREGVRGGGWTSRRNLALFMAGLSVLLSPLSAAALEVLRIGTGGSTGVYYPIGRVIAMALTDAAADPASPLHSRVAIAQNSAGSMENARGVLSGELEVGMVQADVAAMVEQRQGEFAQPTGKGELRAIASLYAEKLQMVVRKDAGVTTIADLRGKRFSLDELGSGTKVIMNIVLAAHGLGELDLQALYLKPAFTEDKMKSGQLQGFALMAGAPNEAVTRLADVGVSLVPIAPAVAADIHRRHPFLAPGSIPGGTYRGVAETPTLEVFALLVVNETMPENIAYAMAEVLFAERTAGLLRQGHPLGGAIALDNALRGLSLPLHPGAERFYRQKRLLP